MAKNAQNTENQINIELPENIAEGEYANLAMISHSATEFVIDFIRLVPNLPKAKVKSRIILTPEHAKRLLAALKDNLRIYEENYGTIKLLDNQSNRTMNFGGMIGEA